MEEEWKEVWGRRRNRPLNPFTPCENIIYDRDSNTSILVVQYGNSFGKD